MKAFCLEIVPALMGSMQMDILALNVLLLMNLRGNLEVMKVKKRKMHQRYDMMLLLKI
jgi:hypothetical protein